MQARCEELVKQIETKPKIEVVDSTDNDHILALLGEGYKFGPNAPSNGHVYLRRKLAQ